MQNLTEGFYSYKNKGDLFKVNVKILSPRHLAPVPVRKSHTELGEGWHDLRPYLGTVLCRCWNCWLALQLIRSGFLPVSEHDLFMELCP